MSMPAEMPAEVTMSPSSIQRGPATARTAGKRVRSSSRSSQWVVASRPSSRPASASRNAPVQTEAVMRARAAVAAIHAASPGRRSSSSTTPPGISSTSSAGACSRPSGTWIAMPGRVTTGPARWASSRVSNSGAAPPLSRAYTRAAVVNTS